MQQILLVALGSAIGGILRYGAGHFVFLFQEPEKHFLPTLTVNLIGSFIIGIAFALSLKQNWNTSLSAFIIVGILGGFTTFSSFSLDLLRLFQVGQSAQAISYLLASIAGGISCVWIGYQLIQKIIA